MSGFSDKFELRRRLSIQMHYCIVADSPRRRMASSHATHREFGVDGSHTRLTEKSVSMVAIPHPVVTGLL